MKFRLFTDFFEGLPLLWQILFKFDIYNYNRAICMGYLDTKTRHVRLYRFSL